MLKNKNSLKMEEKCKIKGSLLKYSLYTKRIMYLEYNTLEYQKNNSL